MSEKVKITQDQADAIERYLKYHDHCDVTIINSHASGAIRKLGAYQALDNMSVYTMSRAVLNGYEIKPEYRVEDWVYVYKGELAYTVKIESFSCMQEGVFYGDNGQGYLVSDIKRKSLPTEIKLEEERRLWALINREPKEFRDGVVGYAKKGTLVGGKAMLETYYERGILAGFFPGESYVELGDEE